MMFSKSFITCALLLGSTASVNAHAAIAPALGVKGNPTRGDVQNPSSAKPCGNVNIAQSIDTSTPLIAAADGSFSPFITSFEPGADGSRSIHTVQVDVSGAGKTFVAAKMIVDGDADPTGAGTQQLSAQLPAGAVCTGGTGKNLCLASFTTTAGFGNCVVVSQGAGPAARAIRVDRRGLSTAIEAIIHSVLKDANPRSARDAPVTRAIKVGLPARRGLSAAAKAIFHAILKGVEPRSARDPTGGGVTDAPLPFQPAVVPGALQVRAAGDGFANENHRRASLKRTWSSRRSVNPC